MTTGLRHNYHFDRVDRRTRFVSSSLIQAVCNHIVQNFQPSKIILFGSRADGKPRPDSDLDLLLIFPAAHPIAALRHRERGKLVMDLFHYRFFSMDVIAMTDQEIAAIQENNEGEWNMILEILKEGHVLYE